MTEALPPGWALLNYDGNTIILFVGVGYSSTTMEPSAPSGEANEHIIRLGSSKRRSGATVIRGLTRVLGLIMNGMPQKAGILYSIYSFSV